MTEQKAIYDPIHRPANPLSREVAHLQNDVQELRGKLSSLVDQFNAMVKGQDELSETVADLVAGGRTTLTPLVESTVTAPETYVRINVTKQSKGYVHESTVSLRGNDRQMDMEQGLADLLRMSDTLARDEIARREALDRAVE